MTSGLLDVALQWQAAGCSVVPARSDGSKAPAAFWKQYQLRPANRDEITGWLGNGHGYHGLGLVCGTVSGNLEMLELEARARPLIPAIAELAGNSGLGELWACVCAGYLEVTPSGGLHILYRVDGTVAGNTKLARRPATEAELTANPEDTIKVLIETRGEGGFTVIAPSGGPVHPTGASWQVLTGGPATLPLLSPDERDALHSLARAFDAMPEPPPDPIVDQPGTVSQPGTLSPGDDYNARADWNDILTPAGWALVGRRGDERYWRRPGKNIGISATTGYGDRGDWLYVFTTSTAFDAERTYTKFAATTLLDHGGDYKDCARALRDAGYGAPLEVTTTPARTERPTSGTGVAVVVRQEATLTDVGNAHLLVDQYGDRLRYVPEHGRWLRWGGAHWTWDTAAHVVEYAKATVLSIDTDDKTVSKHRHRSLSRRAIEAMIALARSHPGVVAPAALLDADPYALCTPAGVVNLLNGTVKAAQPEDLHTRSTAVPLDPAMPVPRWQAFLAETFAGDLELIPFLQRLAGYSATGIVTHHVLPFLHGSGQNGKSVLLEVLRRVLGDYATAAPAGFLMAGVQQHETEVARLSGHRLVICSEVNQTDRFDEAKVKDLTGGDAVTARFMRQDHFTFVPTHHLWLMGNHQPRVTAGGDSFWRRLRFIEFRHRVPDERKIDGLAMQLADTEGPGILAWIAAGARQALADGLNEPASVLAATRTYASEEDALARFISDRCILGGPAMRVPTTDLRKAYDTWCRDEGETPLSAQMLGRELRNHYAIDQVKSNGHRLYAGITVANPDDGPDEPGHWSDR